MKILIVSDTHRKHALILKAIGLEAPFDALIHCGDIEGDIDAILDDVEYPVTVVRGNMDNSPWYSYEDDEIVEAKGHKIFVTHGHKYGVNYGLNDLKQAAKEAECDIACYGHLHVPAVAEEDGVLLINPGSLAQPRQNSAKPSYCVLMIDEAGRLDAEIRYLPGYLLM